MSAVRFHAASSNKKLAPIAKVPYPNARFRFRPVPQKPFCSATYASIAATCSDGCPFKKDEHGTPGGCFIEAEYFTRKMMAKLDAAGASLSGFAVALEEAAAIDGAFKRGVPQDGARGGRDIRIHVGGDVADERSARILAFAAARWIGRGGGSPWSYTHSWSKISAEAFWPISVLASIERPEQVHEVRARGYAPALVVDRFPNGKMPFVIAGTSFIPCPAETLGKHCVSCRLCFDAEGLHARGQGIAFQVHGADGKAAREKLVPLRKPARRAA